MALDSPSLYANVVLASIKEELGDDYEKDPVKEPTSKVLNDFGLYNEEIQQLSEGAILEFIKQFKDWKVNYFACHNYLLATG